MNLIFICEHPSQFKKNNLLIDMKQSTGVDKNEQTFNSINVRILPSK